MPAKRKSKSVVKKPSRALAGTQFKTGFENVDMEMIQIPQLKLVQKTSDEFDEGVPFLTLINSVSKDVLAKVVKGIATCEIIVVHYNPSRVRFASMDDGGGLLCRSNDNITGIGEPGGTCANCAMAIWDNEKGIPAECTKFANYFCIVRGHKSSLPLVLRLGKTSMKTGKQLYNMILSRTQEGLHPSGFSFKITTSAEKNDKGTYGVFKVAPSGESTDAEFNQAITFIELIHKSTYSIHDEEKTTVQEDEAFDE